MSTTITYAAATASRPISALPYLPGLDGMRALAVVAVMVYHANPAWLPGGFLGVEVFFVISGYLITLLLIGEHERTGTVSLRQFYLRRARRLLPALFALLIGVTVFTALFRRDALGQLRGDVLAALGYVSNWYQIWVGQGYTAAGDFAPLRHLWSLAVEEQFYLLWPLAMIGLIRLGRRRLPVMSMWLIAAAIGITAVVAAVSPTGPIGTCEVTPDAYWEVGGRCISKLDFLYLSTPTRLTGLLLGAALALVWRPTAVMRGPLRDRGRVLDVGALVGLVGLGAMCWWLHIVTVDGADPWLFRGGFVVTGVATLLVIAAVTHRRSLTGRLLGTSVLLWIGTRSYGLYLFHWPIYQAMRGVAGRALSLVEFVTAVVISVAVTEVSYRLIETPIRRGTHRRAWRRVQRLRPLPIRRAFAGTVAAAIAVAGFAGASLTMAEVRPNEIAAAQEESRRSTGDPFAAAPVAVRAPARTTTTSTTVRSTTTVAATTTLAPTTTVAVTTTTVAPTTTVAAAPPPTDPCLATPIAQYALGDSVMLGAAPNLAAAGFCVDAVQSRAFVHGLEQVARLRAEGRLGQTVVMSLGTNGRIAAGDLELMMGELAGVPRVVVMSVRADRPWVAPNNELLYGLSGRYPNVVLVDWASASETCPGNCFYGDGIHLRPDGRQHFTNLITAALA